jgi:hypothetical protein
MQRQGAIVNSGTRALHEVIISIFSHAILVSIGFVIENRWWVLTRSAISVIFLVMATKTTVYVPQGGRYQAKSTSEELVSGGIQNCMLLVAVKKEECIMIHADYLPHSDYQDVKLRDAVPGLWCQREDIMKFVASCPRPDWEFHAYVGPEGEPFVPHWKALLEELELEAEHLESGYEFLFVLPPTTTITTSDFQVYSRELR